MLSSVVVSPANPGLGLVLGPGGPGLFDVSVLAFMIKVLIVGLVLYYLVRSRDGQ